MHVHGFHPGHLSSVTASTDRSQPAFAGALPPHPLPERALYDGPKGYVVNFTRTPAAELAGTPLRIQVLCPELTATEFHRSHGDKPGAGRDQSVHEDGGMPVDQVIDASPAALDALAAPATGEVVCVPGLDNAALIDGLAEAEPAIRTAARRGEADPDRADRVAHGLRGVPARQRPNHVAGGPPARSKAAPWASWPWSPSPVSPSR